MKKMNIINKGYLLGLLFLAGLTGCSSDDSNDATTPDEQGTPIAFMAIQNEEKNDQTPTPNPSRAGGELVSSDKSRMGVTRGSLHDEDVNTFNVWGYKNMTYDEGTRVFDTDNTKLQLVFPGYEVDWQTGSAATTTTNSSGWEYIITGKDQTIKYWDWGAKAYRFYAMTGDDTDYTDYEESGSYGSSYKTVYFTMTADASDEEQIAEAKYFSRLWFSTGNEAIYPTRRFGKPVQLEFMKPFAKVRFMFTYAYESESVRLKDKSFKPTDGTKKIERKGTFTVIYPLTGTATSEWYSVTDIDHSAGLSAFTQEYIPEGGAEREVWYTVLPIDPSTPQGSYTLSVKVNGLDKSCVVPAQYMQWKPGFSYTYIFKITDDGGVEIDMVLSAFIPWELRESENYEVYNW